MADAAMIRAKGAAVVLAMLIAALAAAVAATVFADQQRWIRDVEHRRDQVQAQALVMAGLLWARQILQDDARRSDTDHLGEPWAMSLPPIPLENGEIRGAIADAQGRLNVNALGETGASAEEERKRITMLFAQQGGPAAALDAIADWIDADAVARGAGAEDAYYAAQTVPALAANSRVLRVGELAVVKGVTAPALAAVAPFLSALPPGTPVNVNTADASMLAKELDGIGPAKAQAIVEYRQKNGPFKKIEDLMNVQGVGEKSFLKLRAQITVAAKPDGRTQP